MSASRRLRVPQLVLTSYLVPVQCPEGLQTQFFGQLPPLLQLPGCAHRVSNCGLNNEVNALEKLPMAKCLTNRSNMLVLLYRVVVNLLPDEAGLCFGTTCLLACRSVETRAEWI
jgi:hypothetical protein